MAIIVVLIGILLPALSRARQNAQMLQCATNLRTLGQLLVLHAGDHRGYMPLSGNIAPGPSGAELDDPQTLGDPSMLRYCFYDNGGGDYRATAIPAALAPYISPQPVRDDSWEDVDADIQTPGPLQDAFVCPSDQNTLERNYIAPRWINNYAAGNFQGTFLNGWTSYGINGEIFGWTDNGVNGTTGHSRVRAQLSAVPNPSQTMLMCDASGATSVEIWVLGANLSLGDVYLGTGGTAAAPATASNGIFDLMRHRGSMNILYVDGHVDAQPILSNGATAASGALGTAGNSPSGDLMSVSMDKDFR
jgi:prepilin-type processing-associated H-X9-DG protein